MDRLDHGVRGVSFSLGVITRMLIVDQCFEETNSSTGSSFGAVVRIPVGSMKIFDDIYPALLQKREEHAETFDLVRAKMRSIVEYDVWLPHLGHDAHKKVAISLRADANVVGRRNALQAFWIDVDSVKHRAGTEIAAPQVQRSTLSDANLQHDRTTVSVSSKQCVVHPKIMDPFVDASQGSGKKKGFDRTAID